MRVQVEQFELEAEIDTWLEGNYREFWPDSIYIPGFLIKTTQGKGGKPDGFIFDPLNRQWFVIENELIRHGVWNHIAEQLIRFVVAISNPSSLNKVRDRLFEAVESDPELMTWALRVFDTTPVRLLKAIEEFLEYQPKLLVFIDEVNNDMTQLVSALAIDVEVYRLMKIKDDSERYSIFSPDLKDHKPAIVHSTEASLTSKADLVESVISQLQLKLKGNRRGFRYYVSPTNKSYHIKYSKFYEKNTSYWYGVTPENLELYTELGVDSVVFITGNEGAVVISVETLNRYVQSAKTTTFPDGSIRHYHFFISQGPLPSPFQYQSDLSFESEFLPPA